MHYEIDSHLLYKKMQESAPPLRQQWLKLWRRADWKRNDKKLTSNPVILAPTETCVLKITDTAVSQGSKPKTTAVRPPLASSWSDRSSSESKHNGARRFKRLRGRHVTIKKASRTFAIADTWSVAKVLIGNNDSLFLDKVIDREHVPKLSIVHVTNSHFRNAVSCQTHLFVSKSKKYSGKLTARTSKYVERAQCIMKLRIFDSPDPITIMSILAQSKRSYNSNIVPERIALWTLHNRVNEWSRNSFKNLFVSIGVSRVAYVRLLKSNGETGTYIEAVNRLW